MKDPSARWWAWFLTALMLLPLAGLYYIFKSKSKNGVLEAGPLTAELVSGEAVPAVAPAVPSARASRIGKEASFEKPGKIFPGPPSGTEDSGPFPRKSPGGMKSRSPGGAAAAAISGGAAPGGAGTSAADTRRSLPPGPGTAAGANAGYRRMTSAPASLAGAVGGRDGADGSGDAEEIEKVVLLGKLKLGGPFTKAQPHRKPGAMLFDPRQIIALGGRVGQGNVSMERNSKVTLENFNPSAEGVLSSNGKEPPGPKIPAGNAPALPSSHLRYILQAAQSAGVDPALIAATAARESNFRYGAYRAEPQLKQVLWRAAPGSPAENYFDGSLGPMQVLRSNFLSSGIGSDTQANDLATNYRIGAQIIRGDQNAFPNDAWKAVAAYNVGIYGAQLGRVPANNYTDTILQWRNEYERAIASYR